MTSTIALDDAEAGLTAVVRQVTDAGARFIITVRGVPSAMIVPIPKPRQRSRALRASWQKESQLQIAQKNPPLTARHWSENLRVLLDTNCLLGYLLDDLPDQADAVAEQVMRGQLPHRDTFLSASKLSAAGFMGSQDGRLPMPCSRVLTRLAARISLP